MPRLAAKSLSEGLVVFLGFAVLRDFFRAEFPRLLELVLLDCVDFLAFGAFGRFLVGLGSFLINSVDEQRLLR